MIGLSGHQKSWSVRGRFRRHGDGGKSRVGGGGALHGGGREGASEPCMGFGEPAGEGQVGVCTSWHWSGGMTLRPSVPYTLGTVRSPLASPSIGNECHTGGGVVRSPAFPLSWAACREGTESIGASRVGSGGIPPRGDLTPWWECPYVGELELCVGGLSGAGVEGPASLLRWVGDGVADVSVDVWGQQGKEGTRAVRSGMPRAGRCRRELSLSCRARGKKVGETPSHSPSTTFMVDGSSMLQLLLLEILLLN